MKNLLKYLLPPALIFLYRKFFISSIKFSKDYPNWNEAKFYSDGYDLDLILSNVKNASLKVKNNEFAYERDSVLFTQIDYSWQVTTALLLAAAKSQGTLNVLDFGGSLGSCYYQNRIFLNLLSKVHWGIVEQSHFVKVGRENFSDSNLEFYENISDFMLDNLPNVILLSSVLQYLEDPYAEIKKLSHLDATILVLDRTPFYNGDIDKIVIQSVPSQIYKASYPMRIFSKTKFLNVMKDYWNVLDQREAIGGTIKTDGGITMTFMGMIFEAKK
jgi:putative methyltransferase (TIGR04325 family)